MECFAHSIFFKLSRPHNIYIDEWRIFMDGMDKVVDIMATGILDSLLLFLVIPFSIPTFLGYHFLVQKRNRHAGIAFAFSFVIALIYIAWIGFFATFVIFFYISFFYLLVMGPFWLMDRGIRWYEKKYIYDKYSDYLRKKKESTHREA